MLHDKNQVTPGLYKIPPLHGKGEPDLVQVTGEGASRLGEAKHFICRNVGDDGRLGQPRGLTETEQKAIENGRAWEVES